MTKRPMIKRLCLALVALAWSPAFVNAQDASDASVPATDPQSAAERYAFSTWPTAGAPRAGVELSTTAMPGWAAAEVVAHDESFLTLTDADGATMLVSRRQLVTSVAPTRTGGVTEMLNLDVYVASTAAEARWTLLELLGATVSRADAAWQRGIAVAGQALDMGEVCLAIPAGTAPVVSGVGAVAFVRANVVVAVRASSAELSQHVIDVARALDQSIVNAPAQGAAGARLATFVVEQPAGGTIPHAAIVSYVITAKGDQDVTPHFEVTGGGMLDGQRYYAGDSGRQTLTARGMDRFGQPSAVQVEIEVGARD